ncbi:MAG: hypothetical protein QHH74_06745 [Spirochaetota bacterium]|nr:hypothetical protein [Spirochaetota bacterium]
MLFNEKMFRISLEGKVSIIFGILAFFVSLLFGIIAGNKISILFSRVLFFTVIYAAIGYGSLLIIKRLVPEVYEILNQSFEFSQKNVSQEEYVSVKPDETSEVREESATRDEEYTAETSVSGTSDSSYNEVFTPLEAKDFTNLSTKDSKPKKMGKHIVLDDKKIQYEPKIMAEAIRTMLKRDKD